MKFIETVTKSRFSRVFPFLPLFHLIFPGLYFLSGAKRRGTGKGVLPVLAFVVGLSVLYRLLPGSLDLLVTYAALTAAAWCTQSKLREISADAWIAKKPLLRRQLLMFAGILLVFCLVLVILPASTGIGRRTDRMLQALETQDEAGWTAQLHPMMRKTTGNLEAFEEQLDPSIDISGALDRSIPIRLHFEAQGSKTVLTVTYCARISGDRCFLRVTYLKNSAGEGISSFQILRR